MDSCALWLGDGYPAGERVDGENGFTGGGVREGLLEGTHLRKVSHSSGGKSALILGRRQVMI